jgi:hypothetical protein
MPPRLPPSTPGSKGYFWEHLGIEKGPGALILLGPSVFLDLSWLQVWSRRQESNLYLPLRRRPFYPLNYGERAARILACGSGASGRSSAGSHPSRLATGYSPDQGSIHCQRQVQIRSTELSSPDCARSVNRRAIR